MRYSCGFIYHEIIEYRKVGKDMLFTVLHGLSGQSVEEVTASIVLLEEKIWKKSMQASPDVILHRIKTYSDGLWRVRLKHCNLSTIPKKGAQNQAPLKAG